MKDDNDKMLQQFFSSVTEKQIADDGFSEAVIDRIKATDKRMICLSRIWTLICSVGGVTFLIFTGALSKLFSFDKTEAFRSINEVMAYVMSYFEYISALNFEQIPQFVYLIPLAVTAIVAGAMIKNYDR